MKTDRTSDRTSDITPDERKNKCKTRNVVLFDGEKFYRFTVKNGEFSKIITDIITNILTMDFSNDTIKNFTVIVDGYKPYNLPFDKEKLLKIKEDWKNTKIPINQIVEEKDVSVCTTNGLHVYDQKVIKKIKILTDIMDSDKPFDNVLSVSYLIFDVDGEEFKVPTEKVKIERLWLGLMLGNAAGFFDLDDLNNGDILIEKIKTIEYNYEEKPFKEKSQRIRNSIDLCNAIVAEDNSELDRKTA